MEQADWTSPGFLTDPYPDYKHLRESDPVHYDAARDGWIVTRWHDVNEVLRDTDRFSAEQGASTSMLVMDPPDHTRLRGLVSKAFTPKTVHTLAPRIHEIVDELLESAASRGEMDVIADFAYPLPITVIAELLGVEKERRDFFREASQKIAFALGYSADPQTAVKAGEGRTQLYAYFDELIEQRRAEPRDDLVSSLIATRDGGDLLSHAELLSMLLLLLIGGHETTVNTIGNGLLALTRHPDQLELLRSTTGVEKTAVEEILRYDSPVQYTGRVAAIDTELGGRTIRAGQPVRVMLASANRDPDVFSDPDCMDITRDPNPHMAFGGGIHFCLGAQLARLEAAIAIPALVRRFPNIRLASETVRWRPAPVLRGLEALPVLL